MNDSELQAINKKLDRILWYIEDDKATGRKGMYHRISVNEKDISQLKSDKRFLLGISAGISFFASIVTFVLAYVFNFLKH